MHQSLQGATFHVEHAVPRSQGGDSTLDNLTWSCPSCNLHKADRVEFLDSQTGILAPIFNPRVDRWTDHFTWSGYRVDGLSPKGRATIAALELNDPRRILVRTAEETFGLFPP